MTCGVCQLSSIKYVLFHFLYQIIITEQSATSNNTSLYNVLCNIHNNIIDSLTLKFSNKQTQIIPFQENLYLECSRGESTKQNYVHSIVLFLAYIHHVLLSVPPHFQLIHHPLSPLTAVSVLARLRN